MIFLEDLKTSLTELKDKIRDIDFVKLKDDMQAFIDQLLYAIPAMFESKEYRTRIERTRSKYKNRDLISIFLYFLKIFICYNQISC